MIINEYVDTQVIVHVYIIICNVYIIKYTCIQYLHANIIMLHVYTIIMHVYIFILHVCINKYTFIHIYVVMYTCLSSQVYIIRYTHNTYVHFQMLQVSLQHCCWASYPIWKQFTTVNLVALWRSEFSYLKSTWSYHTNIMDFKNSRKRFRFPTSGELLNQRLYDKKWPSYSSSKVWPTVWRGDVIDDVMSAPQIIHTITHVHLYTCKIVFVWHRSFLVQSDGQTSWNTHTRTQTNKD